MLSLTAYYIGGKLLNNAELSNGLTRQKKNFCVSEILMFLCKGSSSYKESFKLVKMTLNRNSASGSVSQTGLFRLQCKPSRHNNCGTADHGPFQRPIRGYIKGLFFSLCQVESKSSLWLILFFSREIFLSEVS